MAPDEMKALIAEARRLENDYGDSYEVMCHMSDLADALEAARDWKAQAMTVLSEWEATYEAAGSPGSLGQSKAVALREEVERLRALSAHSGERFAFTDAEWREYQAMPEQGYSHRGKLEFFVNRWLSAHPAEETVLTVEALDALPVGSVVQMTGTKAPFYRHSEGWFSTWAEGKPVYDYIRAEYLPASILYRPAPEGSET